MASYKTEPWPIDYESLKKGDVIAVERCEQIIGSPRTARYWRLMLLALRDQLAGDLKRLGKHWTLRIVGDQLEVLTDADASEYNAQMLERRVRGMMRDYRQLAEVDRSRLSAEENSEHDQRLIRGGKFIQAIGTARRELRPIPHKRSTPGLPPPEDV